MLADHDLLCEARNALADALKTLLAPAIMGAEEFRLSLERTKDAVVSLNTLIRLSRQKGRTVYLCGPINGRSDDDCRGWREEAKARFSSYKDPMDRDYRGRELEPGIAADIVTNDKNDIVDCDVVLVYYDKPSVGTSMEVLFAHGLRIPIVLVNRSVLPLSPWLLYHCSVIVGSLDEGISWINR